MFSFTLDQFIAHSSVNKLLVNYDTVLVTLQQFRTTVIITLT